MNLDKGFVPKKTDEQKLASIRSQRESIVKILEQLAEQELQIIKNMKHMRLCQVKSPTAAERKTEAEFNALFGKYIEPNTDNNEPDRKD